MLLYICIYFTNPIHLLHFILIPSIRFEFNSIPNQANSILQNFVKKLITNIKVSSINIESIFIRWLYIEGGSKGCSEWMTLNRGQTQISGSQFKRRNTFITLKQDVKKENTNNERKSKKKKTNTKWTEMIHREFEVMN